MSEDGNSGRTLAQFFFEMGYGACWADAFVKNSQTPPFPLTDADVERAWAIASEAYDDPAEWDRWQALADATPELLAMLIRYRNGIPLGNQPHMIAHEADALIAKATPQGETV